MTRARRASPPEDLVEGIIIMSKLVMCVAALAVAMVSAAGAADAKSKSSANPWAPGGKLEKVTRWVPPVYHGADRAIKILPKVMPTPKAKAGAYAGRVGWETGKVVEKKGKLGEKLYRATGGK